MFRAVLKPLCRLLFRVRVSGLENYAAADGRVLLVANHLSSIDALLLSVFLPRLKFVVLAGGGVLPFMVKRYRVAADDDASGIDAVVAALQANKQGLIFPERYASRTASLMKIYQAAAVIADKADASILPVHIDGTQYSWFSAVGGGLRRRLLPEVRISILPSHRLEASSGLHGAVRSRALADSLYDVLRNMMFISSGYRQTLFQSLLEQCKLHGRGHVIAEDIKRQPMNYGQLLMRCFLLGEKIADNSEAGERLGIMLPNSLATMVVFFAMQAYGRVPTMLNFTSGASNICAACNTAVLKTVYTSRLFIKKASLQEVVDKLQQQNVQVLYLEDVAKGLGIKDKLKWLLLSLMPQRYYNKVNANQDCDSTAVVLFTSGSEASPKGVALSHSNLQANRNQVRAVVDFVPKDVMFNALPVFHSFALTAGMLLPVLSGIRTFLYPSPLDYRTVPELIYQTGASISFATDTFLQGYAKHAHPYDLHSLRYIFAGAEKLKPGTLQTWLEKYGIRVFEGYGVTETSPALAVNTAMHNKAGTVGRFLPGIEYSLEEEEGITEGGRLVVGGPNIMQGYIKMDNPGQIVKCERHDTGDIVSVDSDGYVSIVGRASRFAKIAGEMVSLAAVESVASTLWPEQQHAALALQHADAKEEIVLATTNGEQEKDIRQAIRDYIQKHGIGSLHLPKTIICMEGIPLTGTGKTDYRMLEKQLQEK